MPLFNSLNAAVWIGGLDEAARASVVCGQACTLDPVLRQVVTRGCQQNSTIRAERDCSISSVVQG